MTQPTGFLRHIEDCTRHDISAFSRFLIDGKSLGWVKKDIEEILLRANGDFVQRPEGLCLNNTLSTYEIRTNTLSTATDLLCAHFNVAPRKEMYPVIEEWNDPPLAEIDRIAVPWFGTRGFGVHVNGYVKKPDGIYIWIAERAHDRLLDPGKLDHIVAGGSPIGLSIHENLAKEAYEEAGIPKETAQNAELIGTIGYKVDRLGGLRNDTLFIFDLLLDEAFQPINTDGEVASFALLPIAEVAALVHDTDRFKFNCNLVIIDFLMRHGFIAETHPEYESLTLELASLRQPYLE
jgi:8-oxo-dGTP pyrophosphatase MutT (NUDIX family)